VVETTRLSPGKCRWRLPSQDDSMHSGVRIPLSPPHLGGLRAAYFYDDNTLELDSENVSKGDCGVITASNAPSTVLTP
jgi:hypothetical protein